MRSARPTSRRRTPVGGWRPCPRAALWRRLAGLGVTALAVPERWGGLGASLADVAVACEELGHHALPGPVAGVGRGGPGPARHPGAGRRAG